MRGCSFQLLLSRRLLQDRLYRRSLHLVDVYCVVVSLGNFLQQRAHKGIGVYRAGRCVVFRARPEPSAHVYLPLQLVGLRSRNIRGNIGHHLVVVLSVHWFFILCP